jgi:hypothetical protein
MNMSTRNPPTSTPEKLPPRSDVTAAAALSICESLMLSLNDRDILPEHEIIGILRDAAAAHSNDPGEDGQAVLHECVADLINRIIDGGNSVRRP